MLEGPLVRPHPSWKGGLRVCPPEWAGRADDPHLAHRPRGRWARESRLKEKVAGAIETSTREAAPATTAAPVRRILAQRMLEVKQKGDAGSVPRALPLSPKVPGARPVVLSSCCPVVDRPVFWEVRPRFRPGSTVGRQDNRTKGRAPRAEGAWGREKTEDLRDGRDKRDERPMAAGDGGGPKAPFVPSGTGPSCPPRLSRPASRGPSRGPFRRMLPERQHFRPPLDFTSGRSYLLSCPVLLRPEPARTTRGVRHAANLLIGKRLPDGTLLPKEKRPGRS